MIVISTEDKTSLLLKWDLDPQFVNYKIYKSEDGVTLSPIFSTTSDHYEVTGLSKYKIYTFLVVGVNANNEEIPIEEVMV
jgi:hypothetical protein